MTSSFQPRVGGAGLLGQTQLYPCGPHVRPVGRNRRRPTGIEVGQRHEHEGPLGQPWMRHHEVGIVDHLVAHEQHVDVEGARAPTLTPDPVLGVLEPLGDPQEVVRG